MGLVSLGRRGVRRGRGRGTYDADFAEEGRALGFEVGALTCAAGGFGRCRHCFVEGGEARCVTR